MIALPSIDSSGSTYVALQNSRAQKKAIVSVFLLIVFGIALIFSSLSFAPTAFADDDDDKKTISDALDDYSDDKDFGKSMEKYNQKGDDDPDTFGHVIHRLFIPGYLNKTPDGVAAGDYDERDENCNINDKDAGTPLYHNCDVPNIVAEFIQTTVSMLVPQGMMNASTDNAKIENQWFGLPTKIPGGTVPADDELRSSKYSGLELYGYSFKVTSYNGEWDNIKVFTSARAMSNFGFMDTLTLGVNTIINGVSSGVEKSAEKAGDALSNGDIVGAIGGAYSGFVEGSSSASLNTILDSSDLNVFNTNAWYRVGYGKTAYGFRELTNDEASLRMLNALKDAFQAGGKEVKLDDDFTKLKGGPPKPDERKASCKITDASGKVQEKNTAQGNGMTKEECAQQAKNLNPDKPKYDYSEDGQSKGQTIKEWKKANKDWFDSAKKYNITCQIDDDESKRVANLSSFYACVDGQYATQAKTQEDKKRTKNTKDAAFSDAMLKKMIGGNSSANLNSARARLVCVDENGMDIPSDSGPYTYAYDTNGNFNTACGTPRAPIQNGLFGNGYDPQDSVEKDTRRTALNDTPLGITTPDRILLGTVTNLGMSYSQFATRVANSLVNLSFSPLTETLGLNDIVSKFIKDFRSSVFMSFCVLVISATALFIFADTMFRRRYLQGFSQLAYIVFTYIIAIVVLWNPQGVMKIIDDFPAMVESAIATSIFNADNDGSNNLCAVSGDASSYGGEKQNLFSYAADGNRAMMCSVWQNYSFNAWVNMQFGTSYSNLYSAGNGSGSSFHNTNQDLVGDASVNLGGGVTEKNWALYQLRHMTIGTTTSIPERYGIPVGQTDSNLYRLVDLQAGPNNGQGADSSHFDWWRGSQPAGRAAFAAMSMLNSTVGFIAIAVFSVNKIILTFVTILMLLGLPFVLLVGLFYHGGRSILAKYSWTIVSLIVERILHVVLLAVMLRMVAVSSNSVDNYIFAVIFSIGVAIAAIMLRKKILDSVRRTLTARYGGPTASSLTSMDMRAVYDKGVPKTVKNVVGNRYRGVKAYGAGALMGAIMQGGNLKQIRQSGKQSMSAQRSRDFNQQRREGFGLGQKFAHASRVGEASAKKDLKRQDAVVHTHTASDVSSALGKELKDRGIADTTKRKGRTRAVSAEIDKASPAQRRKLAQAMQEMARAEKARDRGSESGTAQSKKEEIRQNPTVDRVKEEHENVRRTSFGQRTVESKARQQYDKLVDHMAHQEANRMKAKEDRDKLAQSVKDLFKNYQGPSGNGNNTGNNSETP